MHSDSLLLFSGRITGKPEGLAESDSLDGFSQQRMYIKFRLSHVMCPFET
jgi:hypothetical protein